MDIDTFLSKPVGFQPLFVYSDHVMGMYKGKKVAAYVYDIHAPPFPVRSESDWDMYQRGGTPMNQMNAVILGKWQLYKERHNL